MATTHKLLLLALIPLALGDQIEVNIEAGKKAEDSRVTLMGRSIEPVSEEEKKTFKVTSEKLKQGVVKFNGGNPDGCYLDLPTPHGDPWSKYDWRPVRRYMSPISGKVLGISTKKDILATKEFKNTSADKKATYKADITQQVEDTMSTTWSKSGTLTIGQEINYGVDLKVASVGGSTKFEFSGTFGKDTTKSQTITLGSSTGIEIELKAGEAVTVTLECSRGTMETEVVYTANLFGEVVVFHPNAHKGHYIWAHDIAYILDAIPAPRTMQTKQKIKIGFYAEAKVIVADSKTKEVRAMYSLDNSSGEPQWQLMPEFRNGTLSGL